MTGSRGRPARRDVLVASCCVVISVMLLLLLPVVAQSEPDAAHGVPAPGDASWWAVFATLVAQSALLAWRRRRPEAVAVVVAAAVPVGAAVGMGAAIGLTSVALLVAVYTLAVLRSTSRVRPQLAAAGALVASGHAVAGVLDDVTVPEAVATGLLQVAFLLGGPLVVAALVVARRESRTAGQDRLRALEREHEALVQAAVARERTAMARELHDIAAHHLTGIAVMSAAIASQIDTDPGGAKEAVGEVRRQSTAVLRDLRSLVGLLRDADGQDSVSSGGQSEDRGVRVETVAGVPGLVAEVVAAGQDVAITVLTSDDGRPLGGGVGPLAQLASYRTVQESLANAGRHAPGAPCLVELDDRDPEHLMVTVRNGAARSSPDPGLRGGLGLVGMKERAELTGSRLDVGATPDGGWLVLLRTPRTDIETAP